MEPTLAQSDDPANIGITLKEITDVVASLDDPQGVLDSLVRLVSRLLKVDRCSLMLIDPETRTLRIRAAHNVATEVVRSYSGTIGEGIAGWVALHGRPILITDVESHPIFKHNSGKQYSTNSLLSVPLAYRGRTVGVLNVNNKLDGKPFTKTDELWLGTVANFVVISLEKARMSEIVEDKERIDADLRLAEQIQRGFLPKALPSYEMFRFAAYYASAYKVAGDFYDVIPLARGRTCVIMGDVCGKGVASALYMARVVSYVRAIISLTRAAEGLLDALNRFLAAEWTDRSFVTACLLEIQEQNHLVSVYSAGHRMT